MAPAGLPARSAGALVMSAMPMTSPKAVQEVRAAKMLKAPKTGASSPS